MHSNNEPASICSIAWLSIAADHPALPGHFPGRPIVPGVVILERMLELMHDSLPQPREVLIKSVRPELVEGLFSKIRMLQERFDRLNANGGFNQHLPSKLIGLPSVKFLRAAVVGECLLLGVEFISATQGRCICRCNAQTVAQCSFTLTAAHPGAA